MKTKQTHKTKETQMGKLEMAIYVTDTLFRTYCKNRSVGKDNWKVKLLMKNTKATLSEFYVSATKVRENPSTTLTI